MDAAEGPPPYGWVCGGWEGIRRGKIMPNRWQESWQLNGTLLDGTLLQGTLAKYHVASLDLYPVSGALSLVSGIRTPVPCVRIPVPCIRIPVSGTPKTLIKVEVTSLSIEGHT